MAEKIESKGVEEFSKNVDNPDDATELINKIDKMIKNKNNNILTLAYHHGIHLKRKFKTKNKFTSAVSKLKIGKTTINCKIDIVKIIDEYPKIQISCISLFYLKNNLRVIK